jgi:hypothetical protein
LVHNISDITGTGVAVPLIAGGVRTAANWVQLTALPGNSADVRFGDSTTSASSGARIAPGAGQLFPATANSESLDLAQCFVFLANGDKVTVVYGRT